MILSNAWAGFMAMLNKPWNSINYTTPIPQITRRDQKQLNKIILLKVYINKTNYVFK